MFLSISLMSSVLASYFEVLTLCWLLPAISLISFCNKTKFDGYNMMDWISSMMVFVTLWVFFFAFVSMKMSTASLHVMLLMYFLISESFMTTNFLVFYILFEFSFILMFLYLLSWGKNPERLQASTYMLMFTLTFSLPFLVMLIDLSSNESSIFFYLSVNSYLEISWIFMLIVFMVKLPIYCFHLWLPKAHVEAPVAGSMVLAGVLLKLGGYGILRFMPTSKMMAPSNSMTYCTMLMLSLISFMLMSMICFRFMDLKMVIAYSSVVHMSTMLTGLIIFSNWSEKGSMLMMLAHGFISSLMFYLMTYAYDSLSSRSLMVLKGVYVSCPIFCLLWGMSCVLNLGVPPFMSFFSELLLFSSMGMMSFTEMGMVGVGCFFTGVYCIWALISLSHGSPSSMSSLHLPTKNIFVGVWHMFFILLFPLTSLSF